MEFDNATGLTFVEGSNVVPSSLLEFSETGAGDSSDPVVYSYAYEFTEVEATTLNFPDLESDKSLTCYMTQPLVMMNSVTASTDLSQEASLSETTVTINTADNPANTTSDALDLVGKKTILALTAWLGLIVLS